MKALKYGLTRLLFRTVGQLSEGMRLTRAHGLTSGRVLDYVYRNEPHGRSWLGQWLDRRYLAEPGWEAIRARRENLEALLVEAVQGLRDDGLPVHLLDIASGPADYILSVLERVGGDATALCRDLDERWLARGRKRAAARGLTGVRFGVGDALDGTALRALRPRPTCVVVSGFYDWILDDAVVERSLADLGDVVAPGGAIVVTNQAGHRDLELMQHVFEDFNGHALRMTTRPVARIESWLAAAGFTPATTRLDRHGYYSVTLARRIHEPCARGGPDPATSGDPSPPRLVPASSPTLGPRTGRRDQGGVTKSGPVPPRGAPAQGSASWTGRTRAARGFVGPSRRA